LAEIAASDYGSPSQRFCGKVIGGAALRCLDRADKNIYFLKLIYVRLYRAKAVR